MQQISQFHIQLTNKRMWFAKCSILELVMIVTSNITTELHHSSSVGGHSFAIKRKMVVDLQVTMLYQLGF